MSLFKQLYEQMIPAIKQEMKTVLLYDEMSDSDFYGLMHYHMGWSDQNFQPIDDKSGKQIRPILCLLSCAAAGGDWRQALPAAAAIEILHNFSLVHDDIEDISPTRRGRPTVWKIWGIPLAINSGDAMFSMAYAALARLADTGVPPERVINALRRFNQTCIALTNGQHMDMRFELQPVVEIPEYMAMITGKTAVLIALSMELGALIAGADENKISHYAAAGQDLGLAFQIRDDILGIWGEEDKTGKSAATDIATRKKSLPILHGLSENDALSALYQQEPIPPDFVDQAITLLEAAGSNSFCAEKERITANRAMAHLEAAEPEGDAAKALFELSRLLLGRQS